MRGRGYISTAEEDLQGTEESKQGGGGCSSTATEKGKKGGQDAQEVLLVSIRTDIREISELIRTMGYRIRECVIQKRSFPDKKYYVGEGKLQEIKELIAKLGVQRIIVNDPLHPTQIYYIEKETGAQVVDRTLLILEIFAKNANSVEAKLQVELAKLQYEIPLMREYVHRYKTGEHSGAYGGGEYLVDQYYDLIKRRAVKIKATLEKYRMARELQRKRRAELNFFTVALAGYTNAGKTTLMNTLTNENSLADEHMFTTLSTLVRKISVQKKRYLIVDTVGFIDGLPLYVIDAFRSTYEEIYMADVVLVLVDASDDIPEMLRKLNVVTSQIKQYANKFGGSNNSDKKILYVLTKIDCADELKLQQVSDLIERDYHARPVLISVHSGVGINELIERIDACVGGG